MTLQQWLNLATGINEDYVLLIVAGSPNGAVSVHSLDVPNRLLAFSMLGSAIEALVKTELRDTEMTS